MLFSHIRENSIKKYNFFFKKSYLLSDWMDRLDV
jgi:hypothetical protein